MKSIHRILSALIVSAIVLGLLAPLGTPGQAQTPAGALYTVNSRGDANDGACDITHCSLREAINAANASAGQDTIRFNIPYLDLPLPFIYPNSALPISSATRSLPVGASSARAAAVSPAVGAPAQAANAMVRNRPTISLCTVPMISRFMLPLHPVSSRLTSQSVLLECRGLLQISSGWSIQP